MAGHGATENGLRSTTASSGPIAIVSSPKFSSLMRSADILNARSSCPNRTVAQVPGDHGLRKTQAVAAAVAAWIPAVLGQPS